MQVLDYISNFSSSDTDTDSDTDSGNHSNDNVLPEMNYYKMSNLTGENLIIDLKPDPDDTEQKLNIQTSDNQQKPDIEQSQNLKENPNNK